VIKIAMSAITSAVVVVIGVFKSLWNVIKIIFWPFETIIKVIIGLFTGGIGGAIDALLAQFGEFGKRVLGVFGGIGDALKGVIDFIKDVFGGIGEIAGVIGGIFGGKKGSVQAPDIAVHAAGGIFKQPHIAEIAEKGAEAVVPLNNTSHGYDIWMRSGELGGYLKTASEQSPAVTAAAPVVKDAAPAVTAAAPVSAATPPVNTPEFTPVMAAASQKISSGDTTVRIDFKMTNNFNGGTPDGETVKQISEAGQKAGDDFEARVKSVFESITRDRMRVS
jgi:hypothetical protein